MRWNNGNSDRLKFTGSYKTESASRDPSIPGLDV